MLNAVYARMYKCVLSHPSRPALSRPTQAACDLAVASTRSRFATPGVNIGLFCHTPAVSIARTIGRKKAMQVMAQSGLLHAPLEWIHQRWGNKI